MLATIRFLLLSAASTTLISLGASPSATRAADVTWTVGGNSEYWSTPANWSTQQVPGPSDNVTIAWSVDGSLHDPVLLDVDATINMLTMGSTGQHITAKLDIKQSNSLTVLNDIDMFGDVAPFISMSGKSSLTVNGDIRLNATGDGSIQIRGGTFKHAVDKTIHLGGESGTNSGFGFHSAGTTVTTGTVYAGDKGRGQITLTTGASMTSAALHVASGATSTGLVDMQSSDTIFHVTGEVGVTEGFIDSDVVLAGNQPEDSILVFNRSDEKLFDKSISGAGSVIQRGPGTTTFAGNNSYSGGLTVENGVAKAGVADVAFGLGRVAIKSGATLDLADFDTTIGGLAGEESGDGNITLGSGALTLNQDFDSQFSGIISGTGDLIKNDSGKLTLYGANTYSGTTSVTGGQLVQGAAHAFSAASAYSVANNALLDLGGFSTAVASLSNSGTVHFGGAGGTVLSVSGDYTGGGTLVFNTVLGDDSSKTDQLKVDGDTSGTTTVMVVNRDGLGAQTKEGIKIIDVAGQSNGIFNLASDFKTKDGQQAVVAGAYAYTLHKNGVADPADGDWYLRSQLENPHPHPNPPHPNPPHPHPEPTPHFNPATPVYEGYSQTLQALNKLPSLQQRVGNRYWDGAANPVIEQGADSLGTPLVPADATIDARGIWGRIEGVHNRFQLNRSTTGRKQEINTLIIQAGVDGQFYEDESGRLIDGITGQYGKARSDISSAHGDGQIDTQGWGLGGTLTWYGNDGFYVDTQAQAMWYYSDLDSHTANKSLIDDNKAFGYSLSVEVGKRVELDSHWSLTPQAQLVWSSVDFDTFHDGWKASVSNRNGDSLNARFGLSADYRNAWRDTNGQIVRSNVYGIVNLYQELMSGDKTAVAGVRFKSGNDKTWAGIGAGGTYSWDDDKYALFGEGSLNASLDNADKNYAVKGSVGFKVRW